MSTCDVLRGTRRIVNVGVPGRLIDCSDWFTLVVEPLEEVVRRGDRSPEWKSDSISFFECIPVEQCGECCHIHVTELMITEHLIETSVELTSAADETLERLHEEDNFAVAPGKLLKIFSVKYSLSGNLGTFGRVTDDQRDWCLGAVSFMAHAKLPFVDHVFGEFF